MLASHDLVSGYCTKILIIRCFIHLQYHFMLNFVGMDTIVDHDLSY